MLESDPRNPYGPNYEELPHLTKMYYKFTKMKKYIHFDSADEEKMMQANYKFLLGLLGTFSLSFILAYATKEFILQRVWRSFYISLHDHGKYYYSFCGAAVTTIAYYKFSEIYINELCTPMLDKYMN